MRKVLFIYLMLKNLEMSPEIDSSIVMTIGDFVEKLLSELDYFQTRFPRIPNKIE